ncbi:MAG: DNA recombination protein RmuC [Litorilituus sp.]|jgi:DNA recombination protein RmuC|nr:DNA recombination protein RmuC [Litorilituus sp.]
MNLTFSQADILLMQLILMAITLLAVCWLLYNVSRLSAQRVGDSFSQQQLFTQMMEKQQLKLASTVEQQMADLRIKLLRELSGQKDQLNQSQNQALEQLITHLNQATKTSREELGKSLHQSSEQMTQRIDTLTKNTDSRLKDISQGVEKRLSDGFEKTTKTFTDILQRLALIDDAQKKITELSNNVVSLQEVLNDKRSRGAFGEVQLNGLIRNVLPEQSFKLQHTLSNGKIADCVLFLPQPTGNVVIDAKFPLESYRTMMNIELADSERKLAQRQFKTDIKKHINDISDKYLIDKETADGAIMFMPAEAIFAEIHGNQSDLVDYANKKRVWLASPTTLMAILTTARSVLKDEATRAQVHIIQAHLSHLAQDFDRFKGRFANLAKHIDQAATDVKQIHTSANKISTRFEKIEQVELDSEVEMLAKVAEH